MKCEEARIQLTDLVAGDTSPGRAKILEEHLSACAACRREVQELGRISAGLRLIEPLTPSDGLRIRFESMLQEAVRNPRSLENVGTPARETESPSIFQRSNAVSLEGWLSNLVSEHRWNLAGLAYCCLTIACLQLATPAGAISIASAQGDTLRKSSEQLAEVRELRRFYAELLEARQERKASVPVDAPPSPAPRSESIRVVRG